MTPIRIPLPFVAMALIGLAAATNAAAAVAVDPDLQRAQAAMADLGQSLRTALQQKIAQDGIVAAVGFCHDEAPRIAAEISARHGVAVGRTSLRHRSPANAPSVWQRTLLDQFAARVAAGEDPASVTAKSDDAGVLRVAKGLKVEAPCAMCHGPVESIAPEVAQAIAARYPGDQATGFREGDLRGMIWAEVSRDIDARTPIAMNADQQRALRAEMRRHLDSVHRVIAALSAGDWAGVAAAASGFAPGRGQGAGRGLGAASNFRDALPEPWFRFARPMHQAMNALAAEARDGRRVDAALARLAEATQQCASCHATFRIETGAGLATAARWTRSTESSP